jgi:DNA-binding NtrC family response regulator
MGDRIDVLVVDEDPDLLDLTGTFLERESDRIGVETERSAREAIGRIDEEGFDCVVSDLRMPEMDGVALFETVAEGHPDLPFFIFSAAADSDHAARAMAAGVNECVQKGAGTEHYRELVELIEDAVGA